MPNEEMIKLIGLALSIRDMSATVKMVLITMIIESDERMEMFVERATYYVLMRGLARRSKASIYRSIRLLTQRGFVSVVQKEKEGYWEKAWKVNPEVIVEAAK